MAWRGVAGRGVAWPGVAWRGRAWRGRAFLILDCIVNVGLKELSRELSQ